MDTAFVLILAALLVARAGMGRDVPMLAFYLSCGAWALGMVWGAFSGVLGWGLSVFGLIERYEAPPSLLRVVDSGVSALMGLVLIAAILVAARGTSIPPAAATTSPTA